MLVSVLKNLPDNSRILDFGCFGWKVFELSNQLQKSFKHSGSDTLKPKNIPTGTDFHLYDMKTGRLALDDDHFDLVIASHVLEHSTDPIALFRELARVTKPGGRLYVEAPSDRAALIKSDADVESHSLFSFWDDPTHIRPWPPAALYRLALLYGLVPLQCQYITSLKEKVLLPFKRIAAFFSGNRHTLTESLWLAKGWSAGALIEKPDSMKGAPEFRYLSLKNVARGSKAALDFRKTLDEVLGKWQGDFPEIDDPVPNDVNSL